MFGDVGVLMVQRAEKIRLSKWEELSLLPVTSLHLFLSLFSYFLQFSVFFASMASRQLEAFQETISSHKTLLTSLFTDIVEFFLGHPVKCIFDIIW